MPIKTAVQKILANDINDIVDPAVLLQYKEKVRAFILDKYKIDISPNYEIFDTGLFTSHTKSLKTLLEINEINTIDNKISVFPSISVSSEEIYPCVTIELDEFSSSSFNSQFSINKGNIIIKIYDNTSLDGLQRLHAIHKRITYILNLNNNISYKKLSDLIGYPSTLGVLNISFLEPKHSQNNGIITTIYPITFFTIADLIMEF